MPEWSFVDLPLFDNPLMLVGSLTVCWSIAWWTARTTYPVKLDDDGARPQVDIEMERRAGMQGGTIGVLLAVATLTVSPILPGQWSAAARTVEAVILASLVGGVCHVAALQFLQERSPVLLGWLTGGVFGRREKKGGTSSTRVSEDTQND